MTRQDKGVPASPSRCQPSASAADAALQSGIANAWRYDVPPRDERPGTQFVAVVGWREHSGLVWHRFATGIAATRYQGRQGYYHEDIERIEENGDMEPGSGVVVGWMPYMLPAFPMERQSERFALPDPTASAAGARSDETAEQAQPEGRQSGDAKQRDAKGQSS